MHIISAGDCDCICLNCRWEGKLKDCTLRMDGFIVCPKCEDKKVSIKNTEQIKPV